MSDAESAVMAGRRGGAKQGAHRSYLLYRDRLYLKVAALLCGTVLLGYLYYKPVHGHSGDSPLGYILGGISAALIVWLAWYGVRKQQHQHGRGTLRGWLSAHVYMGVAVVFTATLHSAFELGLNLHTLAYVLLWCVVLSGLYGVWMYSALPERITENRQQLGPDVMLEEISALDSAALRLADEIDAETQQIVARSVSRVRIGGGVREQLTGNYRRPKDDHALDEYLKRKRGQLAAAAMAGTKVPAGKSSGRKGQKGRPVTIAFVADQLFELGRDKRGESLKKLLDTLARRNALVERLNRDITLRARLTFWQFVHVPLACALLVAVSIHILAVFLYR